MIGLVALLLAAQPALAADEPLVVIVHLDRRAELTREDVAQIYLRRQRFWPDATVVAPLNLRAGDPLREQFTRQVLRRTAPRLADHWNRQYLDGVLPPATLASSAAVLRFVAAERNAIGYVPRSAVDGSVRILLTLPPP